MLAEVDHPDMKKVDEVGQAALAPRGGHRLAATAKLTGVLESAPASRLLAQVLAAHRIGPDVQRTAGEFVPIVTTQSPAVHRLHTR